MARKILIAVVGVIAVFLIVVATRPATFHVERSVVIGAPPEAVFAQVNDLHAWAGWSPYLRADPHVKTSFEGPRAGVGATYMWAGNDQVGEGRIAIEKSEMPSLVGLKVDMVEPWTATYTATFTFAPVPEGTKVTWALDGENSFMFKAARLFIDIDAITSGDFERGLAAMKTAAEQAKASIEAHR